jgi:hypothetical protein
MRKQLLRSGKTRSYLLYAVGEIALVVTGILIALQVNNWNEDRQRMVQSNITRDEVRLELEEAKSAIKESLVFNNQVLRESQKFILGQVTLDSLLPNPGQVLSWTGYLPLKLDLPVVIQETSSDRKIIGDEELNRKLRTIKILTQKFENSLSYMDEFWNNQVARYYIQSGTMVSLNMYFKNQGINLVSIEKLLEDEQYKNIVAMSNLLITDYIRLANRLSEIIDEALTLLSSL